MRVIKSICCASDGSDVEFYLYFRNEDITVDMCGNVSDLTSYSTSRGKEESVALLKDMKSNFDLVEVIGGQCMECEDECSIVVEFEDGTKFDWDKDTEAFKYFLEL